MSVLSGLFQQKSLKYKVASSWDSKEWYHKYRPTSLLDREFVPDPTPDSASSHSQVHDPDHDDNAGQPNSHSSK